ncbi:Deoxyribodipyrimidine photo-lyase [Botrimarina hoheduenensis]|uniref:Deoxyribodipyrimidine photo-lyase n=2 Tax=Botrimarina hoheduenensis TaxID=2528000 RepID=A0A5C5WA02_9BACT|nr:Deoxyribodipyrimidine photo-lyase [Botrimarina hoheduenensis]
MQRMAAIDPIAYGANRNHYDGAVTRLSPYLRHGVLSLKEVSEHVIALVPTPRSADKLLQELAWRDYYRRVLGERGDAVREDLEPYKTGYQPSDYADALPADFLAAQTGNDFVDATVRELHETGYLHNQGRMKIAAYVVHWRRVKWQAGAAWMYAHLLDGDLASNHLSWQWVASTFAAKPYLFNLDNLLRWTGGRFTGCDADGRSPFDASYDELNRRLFA